MRSVELGADKKIYVGGQDELGYFSPNKNGCLQYHSLTHLIPAKDRSFNDVWDIVTYKEALFFRSTNKIFRIKDSLVSTYEPRVEWSHLEKCHGELYAHDFEEGLMRFEGDQWVPLFETNPLPHHEPVTGLLPLKGNQFLITTLKNGIFQYTEAGITPLTTENHPQFVQDNIYGAIRVSEDWVALATSNNGVCIIDEKGAIIQRFTRTEGLQNNNVLSIYLDQQRNLWLGLDNGIDLIAYNSAIKQINPQLQNGSGYTALIQQQRLYAGTTNGLYSVPLQETPDLSFSKGDFSLVENTRGQAWGLAAVNGKVLLGHHEGAFVVDENRATNIALLKGFWNFLTLPGAFPEASFIAGSYKGLQLFSYAEGRFSLLAAIPGFTESSRFIALDKQHNIWVSHPYHGVFRITRTKDGGYQIGTYSDKKGLPSALNNYVFKIKNDLLLATEKGIYTYDPEKDVFEPSVAYQKILGTQRIRYLKADPAGNIWFIQDKNLGVIDYSGIEPAIIYIPELTNKMLSGFEFIYPVNEKNIFLGGEKGFYHINYEKYKSNFPSLHVQLRQVRIIGAKDSLVFGGYFNHVNDKQVQQKSQIPSIGPAWKTIRFEYSSPLFGYQNNLEYSYRLKGFDSQWSEWDKRTEKEYTNLPPGTYSFEVKVRNNLGNESAVMVYQCKILPPWYQTLWAAGLYLLITAFGLYLLYQWLKKKFRLQRKKYEIEQQRLLYIHDLELNKSESELVTLRNEKLEADIGFKNSELASAAMHLVKKGELLTKIKADLSHILKEVDHPVAIASLKKMIKTLNEDDNMDQEWENFTKHFDKVHSDFVVDLKEKHPTITGSEVKLCAYLRMNLSTKEIAQLLNISVRGVEISRYRLRKKLQLPSETNLFDYLITIQSK